MWGLHCGSRSSATGILDLKSEWCYGFPKGLRRKMMYFITDIHGREILDSRGYPTLEVTLTLNGQTKATASVPSGASTGSYEAWELRDEDPNRWHGKGLLKAISHIQALSKALKKHPIQDQSDLDSFLQNWDGTHNKSRVGANTLMGVSLAYAKAKALNQKKELFESFGQKNYTLPLPFINVLNGGAHANNNLNVQEFMLVPHGFDSFKSALRASVETFHCLKNSLKSQSLSTAVGDEGGFAPALKNNESALKWLLQAIEKAGYSTEKHIALAVDVASSEFYQNGYYLYEREKLSASDLIGIYKDWCAKYPLISIEDGLAEEDWIGWQKLTKALGHNTQLVGDDLFVTHVDRLKKGIDQGAGNALLVKINQVGTLSSAYSAVQSARKGNYELCISHRSGETEDSSIVDLSLAWGIQQIKTGSVCRGERIAKYNRLLRIEEQLKAPFAGATPLNKLRGKVRL